MLLNSVAVIGIGVMLFPVLSRYSPRVAIGYVGTRLVELVRGARLERAEWSSTDWGGRETAEASPGATVMELEGYAHWFPEPRP